MYFRYELWIIFRIVILLMRLNLWPTKLLANQKRSIEMGMNNILIGFLAELRAIEQFRFQNINA